MLLPAERYFGPANQREPRNRKSIEFVIHLVENRGPKVGCEIYISGVWYGALTEGNSVPVW